MISKDFNLALGAVPFVPFECHRIRVAHLSPQSQQKCVIAPLSTWTYMIGSVALALVGDPAHGADPLRAGVSSRLYESGPTQDTLICNK